MASEAKTEDDSKAKTVNDTPGVVTFNVPQEAEVALSGGEILLDLPGENDFRLKVPPGIPAGSTIRIQLTAVPPGKAGAFDGPVAGFSTPAGSSGVADPMSSATYKPKPKTCWETVTGEQQLVLVSILAAVVGLFVAVGMVSDSTDAWSVLRSGLTLVLGVLFVSLIACIESNFFSVNQLPTFEAGAALASHAAVLLLFISGQVSVSSAAGLWMLGFGFMFASLFHARHVYVTHVRVKDSPDDWMRVRLMLLILPYLGFWLALYLGFHWTTDLDQDSLLLAGNGAYIFVALGTIAPALVFLPTLKALNADVARLAALQEWVRILWFALNAGTIITLSVQGGTRMYSPIALAFPSAMYFIWTSWPNLLEYYALPQQKVKPSNFLHWKTIPNGTASILVACLCVGFSVVARIESASLEPSGALAPFFALLIGTASHFANTDDDNLHLPRSCIAGAFLVSSYWTGHYSCIATQGLAAVIWSILQLSEWRSALGINVSANKSHQQWFEMSMSPRAYFVGGVLCVASFCATDWVDRWSGDASPSFLVGRAVFSLILLPALSAAANSKRAMKDSSTDAGDCCLMALTIPIAGAFFSSGPWYDNTSSLSLIYAFSALVAIRLSNDDSIWTSNGVKLHESSVDRSIFILYGVLFASTCSRTFFEGQNWALTVASFLSAGIEGVATKNAAHRLAMSRPPILGSLVLFLFSTVQASLQENSMCSGTSCAFVPLILLLPVCFIAAGFYGRLAVQVPLKKLRLDLSLAALAFSVCALPYTASGVGSEVVFKYENDGVTVESSSLPASAWSLAAVLLLALGLGASTVFFFAGSTSPLEISLLATRLRAKSQGASFAQANPSLTDDGMAAAEEQVATKDANFFEVHDAFLAASFAVIGTMSVEMPIVLLIGSILGIFYARKSQNFIGAALVSFLYVARVLAQTQYSLYSIEASAWYLFNGIILLLIVAAWPMPKGAGVEDGNMVLLSRILAFGFTSAAIMMLGPFTRGFGSLAGTICATVYIVRASKANGKLQASVATPVLYFGSIAFILESFVDQYISLGALATSFCALFATIILVVASRNEPNQAQQELDNAVAHFLIFLVFLPFGVGSAAATDGWSPIGASLISSMYAYTQLRNHALAPISLATIIPVVLMSTVGWKMADGDQTLKCVILGSTMVVWGIKLVIIGKYFFADNPMPAAPPALNGKFDMSKWVLNAIHHFNEIEGCSSTFFLAAGGFWILTAFAFFDGYAALTFMLAITSTIVARLAFVGNTWAYSILTFCCIAVVLVATIVDIDNGVIWNDSLYSAAAVVSFITLPLPWIVTRLTDSGADPKAAEMVANCIVVGLMIPFGFAGAYATRGALAVVSVSVVCFWTGSHPILHTLGAAVLPNIALLAGALLENGGDGPELVSGTWHGVLSGASLALCGAFFVFANGYAKYDIKDSDGHGTFLADWSPPDFFRRSGCVALLLGISFGVAGLVGVGSAAMLVIFAGVASIMDLGTVTKDRVFEIGVFMIYVMTAVGVAALDSNYTGVASDVLAAIVVVSMAGFCVAVAAIVFDKERQIIPVQVLDFIIYLWFVAGGLIGAASTDGLMGIIVLSLGSLWSLYRKQSGLCCVLFPFLMFWAGHSLDKFFDYEYPCASTGTPVFIYGLVELALSAFMRYYKNFDVWLKGPGSEPSWANPKDLVPFRFSTALEMSGIVFVALGSLVALYCPGSEDPDLGLEGRISYCALLGLEGVYVIVRGLIFRDSFYASNNETALADAQAASEASKVAFAKLLGFRYRVAGLLFINAAVWFALPLAEDEVLAQTALIVLASMTLLGSGCLSMYWKQDVDAAFKGFIQEMTVSGPQNADAGAEDNSAL